jgi:hypothetical protein
VRAAGYKEILEVETGEEALDPSGSTTASAF